MLDLRRQYPSWALLPVLAALGLGFAAAGSLSEALKATWPLAAYGALLAAMMAAGVLLMGGLLLRAVPLLPQVPLHAVVLRRALRALGFDVPWWKWPREHLGVVDGLQVRLSRPHLGGPSQPLTISVTGIPSQFELETEGLGKRLSRALGEAETTTGDPLFDRHLFVKAQPGNHVLAALDADTRQALVELAARWNMRIADGHVRLETRRAFTGAQALAAAVRAAVSLACRAAWRRRPLDGMVENAQSDPLPGVRLSNLAAVRTNRWCGPKALRSALKDADESVRARAALWLGREGRPVLRELVGSPTLDVDCAAEAVRELGAELGEECGLALLADASRLGRRPVVLALTETLAACGTVAAVPALRALAEAHPLDFGLKHAAQQAISHIQSRLSGAAAGQLAVADGEAGALSLSALCAGEVSLQGSAAEEPATPLAPCEEPRPRRREEA